MTAWRCTIEGHEDVVVNDPLEARAWLRENGFGEQGWRRKFEPDSGPSVPVVEGQTRAVTENGVVTPLNSRLAMPRTFT